MHIFKWKISFFSTERGSFYLTTHTHKLFVLFLQSKVFGWLGSWFVFCLFVGFFFETQEKKNPVFE